MSDFGILALASYHHHTERWRAGGRVNRGNGKQYYISLYLGL